MIERLDGDVTALSNFFSQFLFYIVSSIALLVGILALLFREDWRVGLAISIFAILALAILMRFRNISVPHWTAERQASADLFGFLEERLAGTEDIRSNGSEAYVMRRFYELMRLVMKRSLKANLMFNVLFNAYFLLFARQCCRLHSQCAAVPAGADHDWYCVLDLRLHQYARRTHQCPRP
jgi:ABC-type multidrug transport system fused ATPase/permease subunit